MVDRGAQRAISVALTIGERIANALEQLAAGQGTSQSWLSDTAQAVATLTEEAPAVPEEVPAGAVSSSMHVLLDELLGSGLVDASTVARVLLGADAVEDEHGEERDVEIHVEGGHVWAWVVDE